MLTASMAFKKRPVVPIDTRKLVLLAHNALDKSRTSAPGTAPRYAGKFAPAL